MEQPVGDIKERARSVVASRVAEASGDGGKERPADAQTGPIPGATRCCPARYSGSASVRIPAVYAWAKASGSSTCSARDAPSASAGRDVRRRTRRRARSISLRVGVSITRSLGTRADRAIAISLAQIALAVVVGVDLDARCRASSVPVVASTMCAAMSAMRRRERMHPPVRVDRSPDGHRRRKSTALRPSPQLPRQQRPPYLLQDLARPRRGEALPAFEPTISARIYPGRADRRAARAGARPRSMSRRRSSCALRTRIGRSASRWRLGMPSGSPQTSRLRTLRASVWMKFLRGATCSPISMLKISSAVSASLDRDLQQGARVAGSWSSPTAAPGSSRRGPCSAGR